MGQVAKSIYNRITELHKKIHSNFRTSLEDAIEAGELLTRCKEDVPHGEWLQFLRVQCEVPERTARSYMQAYHDRDRLRKTAAAADLGEGWYRTLSKKPKSNQEVKLLPNKNPEKEEGDQPLWPVKKYIEEAVEHIEIDIATDLLPLGDGWRNEVSDRLIAAFTDAYDTFESGLEYCDKLYIELKITATTER